MSAGYSGAPLPKKLDIKAGHRVALLDTPSELRSAIVPSATEVTVQDSVDSEPLDVILLFVSSVEGLQHGFAAAATALRPTGGLWVCWPKKASGIVTNLNENVIRDIGLAAGLVDNKVCAVDATWSGLRFVYRLRDRPRA